MCRIPLALASLALLSLSPLACGRGERTPAVVGRDSTAQALVDSCAGGALPVATAGGVGAVKLGARAADLRARCRASDTAYTAEGTSEHGLIVRAGAARLLVLAGGPDSTVSRIMVTDSVVKTDRGVGVGSTVGDLRRAHGRVCATLGEGEVVVAAAAIPGIAFATSAAAAPGGRAALEHDAALVPDSARITRLWIYDGETRCGGT